MVAVGSDWEDAPKEAAANARLIAAAPEMVEALESAAKWCEHNGCGVGRTAEMPWLEEVCAILARIKGE